MSRLGKRVIIIPENVKVNVSNDFVHIDVSGPLGLLHKRLSGLVKIMIDGNKITTAWKQGQKNGQAMLGTTNALLHNWILGVSKGFQKTLIIHGLGFKAKVMGTQLKLNLGYSHQIDFSIPKGITITVNKNVEIVIQGFDKELVGLVASQIRKLKKPEPYKGKGVIYKGEQIQRKVGKTAVNKK